MRIVWMATLLLGAIPLAATAPIQARAASSHDSLQWNKPVSYTAPVEPRAAEPRAAKPNAVAGSASGGLDEDAHSLFERGLALYRRGAPAPAATLWRRSARMGDTDSQNCLGYLYYTGMGVTQSFGLAAQWFRKAAEAGASDAQHNLGVMYYRGQGVKKDNAQAMAWLMMAKANGYANVMKELRYVVDGSTPAQIATAKRIAGDRLGRDYAALVR